MNALALNTPMFPGDPRRTDGPNGPNPYLKGGLDTNDVLRAKLDPDFFEGYCIGTIHKRLHEATSRHRNDPAGRLRKYQSVLFYAQQLFANATGHQNNPLEDLAARFDRLPVSDRRGSTGGHVAAGAAANQQPTPNALSVPPPAPAPGGGQSALQPQPSAPPVAQQQQQPGYATGAA